ncbi:hypothetical protein CHS0354_017252 [Potamilus streckersoni]|uniref:Uncharacterized protein n=1 Tax=Potamilus streckersoni TaxID=2493646 RepID=A0AAE0RYN0_9BIVA|nr:hypothetical protein CHS0354_017252 [Potamilus streckersoni]
MQGAIVLLEVEGEKKLRKLRSMRFCPPRNFDFTWKSAGFGNGLLFCMRRHCLLSHNPPPEKVRPQSGGKVVPPNKSRGSLRGSAYYPTKPFRKTLPSPRKRPPPHHYNSRVPGWHKWTRATQITRSIRTPSETQRLKTKPYPH